MLAMNRRQLLGSLAAPLLPSLAAEDRPNVLYILADDLGWGDLRCYNPDSAIPTPNGDRLASQGVRFTDMHSPSSVCTPTRYGILTGRYCWRSRLKKGVLNGYSRNLIEPGRLTAAAMLKSLGYYTAGVGKWHLGLGEQEPANYDQPLRPSPREHGFDYYFGIPASLDMAPYLYFENDRAVERPTSHTNGKNEPRGVFWREGPIAPNFAIDQVLPTLGKKAEAVLRDRASKPQQPFYLYVPLTGPHTPWMPLKQYQGRSKAGLYGDFVAQVDDTVGRILQTLEATRLADNTLVILTSDNGAHWTPEDKALFAHRANANWRGQKADIWDAGHRIPFIARWPGRIKPGVSSQIGCLTDFTATAAEITNFSLPRDAAEDSFSLVPAMTGAKPKSAVREAVVHHSSEGMFSIRKGDWKLCLGLGSGGFTKPQFIAPKPGEPEGQLYQISKDGSEEQDVYRQNPQVVQSLTALLDQYKQQGRSRPI